MGFSILSWFETDKHFMLYNLYTCKAAFAIAVDYDIPAYPTSFLLPMATFWHLIIKYSAQLHCI